MADINLPILQAALAEDLFSAPLNENQLVCLHWSIGRVNSLLNYIQGQGGNGASIEQVAQHMGIHENTAKIYLRWMNKAGLIQRTAGHGNKYQHAVYFVAT